MEKECLDAFFTGNKEEVLKLLPKLHSPETVVDSRDPWKGCTLLHYAACNGWEDVCKLLVERCKCDPTSVNHFGDRPLHMACRLGKGAVVKYLISLPSVLRGINAKNVLGTSPLHWACICNHYGVIEILLESNSVNLTEENNQKHTPLEYLFKDGYSALSRVADKIDWSTQVSVKSFFSVFLVGNSAAGKSTLVAAMLELTRYTPTQHGLISNVEELTAGVVPTQCRG